MAKYTSFESAYVVIAIGFLVLKLIYFTLCTNAIHRYQENLARIKDLDCTDTIANNMFNIYGQELIDALDTNRVGREISIASIVLQGVQFMSVVVINVAK
jgi:hypothetical protein